MPKPSVIVNMTKWEKVKKTLGLIQEAQVKIGFFDGSQVTEEGFTMIELAAVHEFGSEDGVIPERSFIRASLRKAHEDGELAKVCEPLYKACIEGKMTVDHALKILGEWAVHKVREYVTQGPHIPPPLKPATIAAKGSDRPLVDTGAMVNAVQYEVIHK